MLRGIDISEKIFKYPRKCKNKTEKHEILFKCNFINATHFDIWKGTLNPEMPSFQLISWFSF